MLIFYAYKMRIGYLNSLRLIATISVVVLHSAAGLLDTRPLNLDEYHGLVYWRCLQHYAVPMFVMISGALFLNPAKEVGYEAFFHKYVRRIVLALVCFALPMSIAESIVTSGCNVLSIVNGGGNWLSGHSWAHTWYLYMIVCLYLLTPLVKPFVVRATNRDLVWCLTVLFFLSSVLPTIDVEFVDLGGYMLLPPYLFIYLLGYALCWRVDVIKGRKQTLLLTAFIIICCLLIFWKCLNGMRKLSYADPLAIVLAASLFLLFKSFDIKWSIADKLTPYCFGIYLIHPVFINLAYKILNMETAFISPLPNNILLGILFFLLSLASCWVLRKIPWMRKNVL